MCARQGKLLGDFAARPHRPPHGDGCHRSVHRALQHAMTNGDPFRNNAPFQRRGFEHQVRRRNLSGSTHVHLVQVHPCGFGELRLPDSAVRLEHFADLLPGGLHERFLCILNHLRAEARCNAPARIEVEVVHPVRSVWCIGAVAIRQQPLGQRVPASVNRRCDQRVRIILDAFIEIDVGVCAGALLLIAVGEVNERGEL